MSVLVLSLMNKVLDFALNSVLLCGKEAVVSFGVLQLVVDGVVVVLDVLELGELLAETVDCGLLLDGFGVFAGGGTVAHES